MGKIFTSFDSVKREYHLLASTQVGRHWSSDVKMLDPRVPLRWIEVRWQQGEWTWRPLSGNDNARGAGRIDERGWRSLVLGAGFPARITCGDAGFLELICDAPPSLAARDMESGELLAGDDVYEYFEVRHDEVLPIDWEMADRGPLADGEVVLVRGRALRIHMPEPALETQRAMVVLTHPKCTLDINTQDLSATFTLGEEECTVKAECVRVLIPYALARAANNPSTQGWITRDEVHAHWLRLGGKADSPTARIGWEKGKLRTQLAKRGAARVERLIDNRRVDGITEGRLTILPENIEIL